MGDEGLRSVPQKPRLFANQTPLEDELVVLDFVQQFPSWGPDRISRELARKGPPHRDVLPGLPIKHRCFLCGFSEEHSKNLSANGL